LGFGHAAIIRTGRYVCQRSRLALAIRSGSHEIARRPASTPTSTISSHRSTIVALDQIASVQAAGYGGYKIRLKNGSTLISSRASAERVRALLSF
jgi:hypothetical protein